MKVSDLLQKILISSICGSLIGFSRLRKSVLCISFYFCTCDTDVFLIALMRAVSETESLPMGREYKEQKQIEALNLSGSKTSALPGWTVDPAETCGQTLFQIALLCVVSSLFWKK